jgi:hypothetical protein
MDARITRGVEKYRPCTLRRLPARAVSTHFVSQNYPGVFLMADQAKLFLTELRLSGESNHWRVDARYTGATKSEGGGDDADKQKDGDDKKPSSPEEIHLSILVPAGDRSVVDLQIDAMDRAIAFLQTTVTTARQEQLKRTDAARG